MARCRRSSSPLCTTPPNQSQRPGLRHPIRLGHLCQQPPQLKTARAHVAPLNAAHLFNQPIGTCLEDKPSFFLAEAYRQDFLVENPRTSTHRSPPDGRARRRSMRGHTRFSWRISGRARHIGRKWPRPWSMKTANTWSIFDTTDATRIRARGLPLRQSRCCLLVAQVLFD